MRFLAILRDERGFIHKRLIGAATGFFGGGGILGGITGFLGGGGGREKAVPGVLPGKPGGSLFRRIGRGAFTPSFAPPPTPAPAPISSTSLFGEFPTLTIPKIPFGGGCLPGFKLDPISMRCVLDLDPGPDTGLPFGAEPLQAAGMVQPESVCIDTLVCPTFADNKKGVLWMNAMTGLVVCLPRGVNGSGFGLIRKNRPRRKAFVTAAEISALRGQARTKKKAKKFAGLTGQVCVTKGSRARPAR